MTNVDAPRQRLREHGITVGVYPTGPKNDLTDVAGVSVGHVTCRENRIRTGATAILPHAGNLYQDKVPAGLAVLNGFGKFTGATQIQELGEIESPIVLTNTLATGRAIEAVISHTLQQPGNEFVVSINAVVGETNDSRLNDIRAGRPSVAEIGMAIARATAGPAKEGAVGAGTGTVAFGLKGGIGSASRLVSLETGQAFTLGVLVQSNFGGRLLVAGTSVPQIGGYDAAGSIVIILATDAPLCPPNLERLARRAFGGLARTGANLSNGSGDYALAFSTAAEVRRTPARRAAVHSAPVVPNALISPLFEAAIEATEEAILNSLCMATPMDGYDASTGQASFVPALKLDP